MWNISELIYTILYGFLISESSSFLGGTSEEYRFFNLKDKRNYQLSFYIIEL